MAASTSVSPNRMGLMQESRVNADHDETDPVVGTWMVTAQANTPPGTPPLIFAELGSFNVGGTFIDTFSLDHNSQNAAFTGPFAPLAVDFSAKLGIWRRLNGDSTRYAIT